MYVHKYKTNLVLAPHPAAASSGGVLVLLCLVVTTAQSSTHPSPAVMVVRLRGCCGRGCSLPAPATHKAVCSDGALPNVQYRVQSVSYSSQDLNEGRGGEGHYPARNGIGTTSLRVNQAARQQQQAVSRQPHKATIRKGTHTTMLPQSPSSSGRHARKRCCVTKYSRTRAADRTIAPTPLLALRKSKHTVGVSCT